MPPTVRPATDIAPTIGRTAAPRTGKIGRVYPTLLPINDAAAVWSVPASEVTSALAEQPLLVLMHGFGSHERDLAGLFGLLPDGATYVSLRAPLPAVPGSSTEWAWFARTPTCDPELHAIDAASRGVLRWLEHTLARVRGPVRVGLLGFSQGGAMVTHLMRHSPESFACGVNLSGFTASGLVAGDEALAQLRPPLFWGRDALDPVIPRVAIERTQTFLPQHTALDARLYPGAAHGITADEITDVGQFCAEHLLPG